ncbi:MAG: hypothetical protein CR966_00025 [Pseudomonadales bacterium]|nr:MAG: hypothetical protein CR966_00025 [Pseudomonadales bacterium]
MKKLIALSVFLLIGCSQQAKVPDYTVDFLSKKENKPILDKLKTDCLLMQSADKPKADSIASTENCANARVATEIFHKKFNDPNNTKRRVNKNPFADSE